MAQSGLPNAIPVPGETWPSRIADSEVAPPTPGVFTHSAPGTVDENLRGLRVFKTRLLPDGAQAQGTAVVRVLCIIALGFALVQSGLLGAFFSRVVDWIVGQFLAIAIPLLIVAFLASFISRVLAGTIMRLFAIVAEICFRALAFVITTVLGLAIQLPRAMGGRPAPPSTEIVAMRPDGATRAIRIANSIDLPQGTRISALGPVFRGRQAAWVIRNRLNGAVVLSRGVIPTLIIVPVTAGLIWGMFQH
jgi:hypothetical protein